MAPVPDLFRNLDVECSAVALSLTLAMHAAHRIRAASPVGWGRAGASLPTRRGAALGTWLPLIASGLIGIALGLGHFGVAALLFATSLPLAGPGLVRDRGRAAVVSALFGASADLYAEFFAFAGLAFFFRGGALLFTLTLGALIGALMVSYGSAKAEARHVPVPPGAMLRQARILWIAVGACLTPLAGLLGEQLGEPRWVAEAPMVLALVVVAVGANVSAVLRLRIVARAKVPSLVPRPARGADPAVARASAHQRVA